MNEIPYFEAFAFDPVTCDYTRWVGTAPLATIRKSGLKADLAHPYYGPKALCGDDGWACRA